MRGIHFFIALIAFSTAALGQGQFVFNNRVPPDIDARFRFCTDAPGVSSLAGDAYTVQLLGGPVGTPAAMLVPLAATDFRTGAAAGYVNPITVTVPGLAGGKSADILLRFFAGSSTQGTPLGFFGPYPVTVQEAPNVPPNLALGTSPLPPCFPEPSSWVLMVSGTAVLLVAIGERRQDRDHAKRNSLTVSC
jgi:hypothetical protein